MRQDRTRPTLLGGEWVGPDGGEWFEDIDPADTREVVALLPRLTPAQVAGAIDAADRAVGEWASVSAIDRGRVTSRAASLLRERVDEIADEIVREAGKLRSEAHGEVLKSADFLEYYAGLGRSAMGQVLPDERPSTFTHTLTEPLGVVALITAWNDPLLTPARKISPALISGNAVIIKPAEDTPLATLHLARALLDAGLPPEVLAVVVGHPEEVAEPLLTHPAVRAVSFTGSTATAKRIKTALADRNVRFQAETGGKNAAVVFPDADVEVAARTITSAAYAQAGQRCTATSRVVVLESVAADLSDVLTTLASEVRVGPGSDVRSQMGPMINSTRLESVAAAVREGVSAGARVLQGGGRLDGPGLDHGCFLEPTVALIDDTGSALWQEEVFGPVLAMKVASDVDEVSHLVNDSAYGLSAAIFTEDLRTAMDLARRIDVGQIAVNRPTSGWDVHLPFGGFKESGSWSKEQGVEGLDFYTRIKTVAIGYEA